MKRSIYLGFEPRESVGFDVCKMSILRRMSESIPIHALHLEDMQARGLYTRPTERRDGRLYDLLSATDTYNGAMATEFAISRFLVPTLAREGAALFLDGSDMLVRCDLARVFEIAEHEFKRGAAVACVKHLNRSQQVDFKMDGQLQTYYHRKNWTSVIAFNCDMPQVRNMLSVERVNKFPGRDLHGLSYFDGLIAGLPPCYNHLVGVDEHDPNAKIVHWTLGGPMLDGYADVPFAEEWRAEQRGLAA